MVATVASPMYSFSLTKREQSMNRLVKPPMIRYAKWGLLIDNCSHAMVVNGIQPVFSDILHEKGSPTASIQLPRTCSGLDQGPIPQSVVSLAATVYDRLRIIQYCVGSSRRVRFNGFWSGWNDCGVDGRFGPRLSVWHSPDRRHTISMDHRTAINEEGEARGREVLNYGRWRFSRRLTVEMTL